MHVRFIHRVWLCLCMCCLWCSVPSANYNVQALQADLAPQATQHELGAYTPRGSVDLESSRLVAVQTQSVGQLLDGTVEQTGALILPPTRPSVGRHFLTLPAAFANADAPFSPLRNDWGTKCSFRPLPPKTVGGHRTEGPRSAKYCRGHKSDRRVLQKNVGGKNQTGES